MLVLDIGGTYIKHALTDDKGAMLPETVAQTPSDAEGSYEGFTGALSGIIAEALRKQPFTKACVAIAGPFDFDTGVSLMQHKLKALYQKSLRPPFEKLGVDVDFLHDSTAFMLGEAYDGALRGAQAPCCVMLGTGLGFAFMRDGKVCVSDKRSPALTLWNMPWRDGIAEDYVSTRAIQKLYGEQLPVKAIAERARQGDARAARAFSAVGGSLSEILGYIIPRLQCDQFALGGQIAKSAGLFGLDVPVDWHVSHNLDDVALRGASYYALHGRSSCEQTPRRLFVDDCEVRL